jgi:large subunit ribosomal protein L21e
MKKKKSKGKEKITKIFRNLKEGDRVAVVIEPSEKTGFPEKLQGRTGIIEGKRGKAYIVKIKDYNREKRFIIKPVHLKKLK